jgi:3-oxoacyl-[acyl-carrier-protein] synthase III
MTVTHRSRILGVGMALPKKCVTNNDLAQKMETSHDWIVERTGIETRYWVEPGETGASMGAEAAKEATST